MNTFFSRLGASLLGLALVIGVSLPAQAAFPVKYHPGHYMLTYFTVANPTRVFDLIRNEPNFVGIERRYTWRSLEPTRGQYNFASIISDLNYLKSMPTPKRLIIEIDTDSSSGTPLWPDYIQTAEFKGGVFRSAFRGNTRVKRWEPAVQDRLIALFKALGTRFDKEAYIEGVVLDETATGIRLNEWTAATYTSDKMYNGLKRIMSGLKTAFPTTMCIQYINFFSGANSQDGAAKIAGLFQYANQIGMGVGGPDVHVGGPEPSYPYFTTYAGSMPLTAAVQYEDYGWVSPTGSVATVPGILDFARRKLHLNYIFWLMKDPEFLTQVVPLIRKSGAP